MRSHWRIVVVAMLGLATGCGHRSATTPPPLIGTWNTSPTCAPQFSNASLVLNSDGSAELKNLPEISVQTRQITSISGTGKWKTRNQLGEAVVDAYLVDGSGRVTSAVTLWLRERDGKSELFYFLGDPDNAPMLVLARSSVPATSQH